MSKKITNEELQEALDKHWNEKKDIYKKNLKFSIPAALATGVTASALGSPLVFGPAAVLAHFITQGIANKIRNKKLEKKETLQKNAGVYDKIRVKGLENLLASERIKSNGGKKYIFTEKDRLEHLSPEERENIKKQYEHAKENSFLLRHPLLSGHLSKIPLAKLRNRILLQAKPQKQADWTPTPEEMEFAYDTNMNQNDREKLKEEIQKEKSTHKGLKKFLINHGTGSGALAGALAGGTALGALSHKYNKAETVPGALAGAAGGAVLGALMGSVPGLRAGSRVEESFQKNNPDYMKRYYENPRRLDRQLKKDEISAIRERNWANRYDY